MVNLKGRKKEDLPPMKRGRKAIKEDPTATSTRVRTCGSCNGKRCRFCNNLGVVDVGMI